MTIQSAPFIAANVLVAATSLAAASGKRYVLPIVAAACCGLGIYAFGVTGHWPALVLVAAGGLVAAAGAMLQNRVYASERRIREELIEIRSNAASLMGVLAELRARTAAKEARTEEAKKLYEVTRELGAVARVRDMVEEYGKCLRTLFSLNSAHLTFLDEEDPGRAYRSYDLLSAEKVKEKEKPLQILRSHELSPHYFGVKPGNGLDAAAVPLRFKNKVQAVIVLEGARLGGGQAPAGEIAPVLAPLADQLNMAYNRCMLYEEVVTMSQTDGLTEVMKKGYLLERAQEELDRVGEKGLPTTFVMFDIDHFKDYNDTYGHLIGDVVLRHVAGFLRGNVREQDLVGRYGGEEFLVALVETPKEGGRVVAERIRRAVEEFRFPVEDKETGITVSAGLATCPGDGSDLRTVVTVADQAMYRAKQTGRNRVCAAGEE